jgi:hypothetical protein
VTPFLTLFQNQLTVLTEKRKVLELRQSNLQLRVSNALAPAPMPVPAHPATNGFPPGKESIPAIGK